MKIQFKGTKIKLSENEKEYFSSKISKYHNYYPGILMVRMEAERTTKHHKKGDIYRIEMNIEVPKIKVVRLEEVGPDIITAFDTADKKVRIILEKIKEQHNLG